MAHRAAVHKQLRGSGMSTDLGVTIRRVEANVSEPRPDDVDLNACLEQVNSGAMSSIPESARRELPFSLYRPHGTSRPRVPPLLKPRSPVPDPVFGPYEVSYFPTALSHSVKGVQNGVRLGEISTLTRACLHKTIDTTPTRATELHIR